mmetsp:Transcript_51346/g.69943  ORF Transcript_51346/g.69943 Transcript_51346/m.69943 type:complete len:209 (+) Transcript_51346:256-882(+)
MSDRDITLFWSFDLKLVMALYIHVIFDVFGISIIRFFSLLKRIFSITLTFGDLSPSGIRESCSVLKVVSNQDVIEDRPSIDSPKFKSYVFQVCVFGIRFRSIISISNHWMNPLSLVVRIVDHRRTPFSLEVRVVDHGWLPFTIIFVIPVIWLFSFRIRNFRLDIIIAIRLHSGRIDNRLCVNPIRRLRHVRIFNLFGREGPSIFNISR